jgi:hypothetical protein
MRDVSQGASVAPAGDSTHHAPLTTTNHGPWGLTARTLRAEWLVTLARMAGKGPQGRPPADV